MASKVIMTGPASRKLAAIYDPADCRQASGVIESLQDDAFRGREKEDLSYIDSETGKPCYAMRSDDWSVFVEFIEQDDETVVVLSVSASSRFRRYPPRW